MMRRCFGLIIGGVIGAGALGCLCSCGGDIKQGYPIYLPLDGQQIIDARMHNWTDIPSVGLIEPVGAAPLGTSDFLVVDVLVALPTSMPLNLDADRIFESVFNGLAVFNAAEGRGFEVRDNKGSLLRLQKIDLSQPTDSIGNIVTVPNFRANTTMVSDGSSRDFIVAVLRIPLKIDSAGDRGGRPLCVRLSNAVRNYFGLRISDREVCSH